MAQLNLLAGILKDVIIICAQLRLTRNRLLFILRSLKLLVNLLKRCHIPSPLVFLHLACSRARPLFLVDSDPLLQSPIDINSIVCIEKIVWSGNRCLGTCYWLVWVSLGVEYLERRNCLAHELCLVVTYEIQTSAPTLLILVLALSIVRL